MNEAQLAQLAARAAITVQSERQPYGSPERERLTDDYHDLLNSVLWLLEDAGVSLPDPDAPETLLAAWGP